MEKNLAKHFYLELQSLLLTDVVLERFGKYVKKELRRRINRKPVVLHFDNPKFLEFGKKP